MNCASTAWILCVHRSADEQLGGLLVAAGQLEHCGLQGQDPQRPDWPGATDNPAVFCNRRGSRLTVKGADDILHQIADDANLTDFHSHLLRHTFGTNMVRDGVDLITVAEAMGHARLDTTRIYTRPTTDDLTNAINRLPTDH